MYKKRIITERLLRLFETFPVVVLSGARQVGKSTLLRHAFSDLAMVVFDSVTDIGSARQDPDLFLDNHPAPLILDEIQFAGELVASIKRRVDRDRRPGMYMLTGSQRWNVLRTISESLAGRAVFLTLEGFSLSEIAQQTESPSWLSRWLDNPDEVIANKPARLGLSRTLYEQLWTGWMPAADSLPADTLPDFYSGYLQTYIERDARLIADVSDWQQFGLFVRLLSSLTAQEISYNQLGRELGITPQTAQRWLSVLRATFQWHEIPAYSGNTIKRISGKPKGYIADTGLACMLQMISSPRALAGHPLTGAMFETVVAGQFRKLCSQLATPPRFYHWRSHGGAEVDILMERDGVFYPVEVKLTTQPNRNDAQGLLAFRKTYPHLKIAPDLIVSPCESFEKISENTYRIPWDAL